LSRQAGERGDQRRVWPHYCEHIMTSGSKRIGQIRKMTLATAKCLR